MLIPTNVLETLVLELVINNEPLTPKVEDIYMELKLREMEEEYLSMKKIG